MSKSLRLLVAALLACMLSAPAWPQSRAETKSDTKAGPRYNVARAPTAEEIRGWDIDVRPDGQGLPKGKGTIVQGEKLFLDNCSACHGEFGEGIGRWPVLAGGKGSLTGDNPVKTVGSYWPYASTVFDYVRRAMPYGNAESFSVDEYYALVAYVLYLNDVITDQDFELNNRSLTSIKMPNEQGFVMDDRAATEKRFWQKDPCMKNCRGPVKITARAVTIDVTPSDSKKGIAPSVE